MGEGRRFATGNAGTVRVASVCTMLFPPVTDPGRRQGVGVGVGVGGPLL